MTKDKDLPYITKLHPVYGIKLYSIDGTTWSTNPAELSLIQERLEKGLVGSIDKRMIPPRRKAGPRPVGEEVVELEPENEDEEAGGEALELAEEEDDDEEGTSPRPSAGSRDKRIGDALRLLGDELGSDEEELGDESEVASVSAKPPARAKGKKHDSASLQDPATSAKASPHGGKIGSGGGAAKKMGTPAPRGEVVKAPPMAASPKKEKNGASSKRDSVTKVEQPPRKTKKPVAIKAPAPAGTAKAKKASTPAKSVISGAKKVAQGGSKRPVSKKAPAMKSSKGSSSPAKSKNSPKSASDNKQSSRRGIGKKAK